jgi:hypothetical protein
MKLVVKALELLWPSVALAGLWLVIALVAFWFARSTRRPIFLYSGLGALLLVLGEVISPVRVAFHYWRGTPIPGGTAGKVEVLVGAYKYQIAIEAVGAFLFLIGIVREVMVARRRARSNAARAAGTAMAAGALPGDDGLSNASPVASTNPTGRGSGQAGGMSQGRTGGLPLTPYASTGPTPLPTQPAGSAGRPCPRCQAMLSVDAQFCGNCGMQLVPAEPFQFVNEPPGHQQGRTSARSSGPRSPEEFM